MSICVASVSFALTKDCFFAPPDRKIMIVDLFECWVCNAAKLCPDYVT